MPSINDIALVAGVSNATVSRVLANKPHVRQDVRQRVLDAASELGYRPDTTARRLRKHSQSQVIGLVVSDIQNPHFGSVVRGIEDVAYTRSMNVILCNTDLRGEREDFYISLMHSERAAGLIINPIQEGTGEQLEKLREAGTAIVLLGGKLDARTFDSVAVDNLQAARSATLHLVGHGCRRIGVVAGALSMQTARERLKGFHDAMRESGLEVGEEMVGFGNFRENYAYEAARRLLRIEDPLDAIFSCNNEMTFGVLQAARDLGMRIPADLALVGFDDPPWAQFIDPPLTAVSQPSYQIGVEAAQLLLLRLQDAEADARNLILPSPLVIRGSCGCPVSGGLACPATSEK